MKFKTNINCGGCIARVKPHLDKLEGIGSWEVDTDNPDKILKIESISANPEDITSLLKKCGFNAELIN
jgi:copper chaperone